MHILVVGASGKVGKMLVPALIERGHKVTALVHSTPLSLPDSPNLITVKGDIHISKDLANAVANCDAVISTLGSWGTKSKNIVSSATKNLIPAMENAGAKRIISVTGAAAKLPNEKLSFIPAATRMALSITGKPILKDAEEHLRFLQESNLDWTAIRSPIMTNKNNSKYRLRLEPLGPFAIISRCAVVLALIDAVENGSFSKQAPFISVK